MMQDKPRERPQLNKNGFTFKQFFVAHDRCAMKVGTDAILLGAWAPVAGVKRILDIGSGSGLIALMLAQRTPSPVNIDAVELEPQAALQAQENVQQSPWPERIQIHQQDIADWAEQCDKRYSLIVSNPPYFAPGVACSTAARDSARATASLDHQTHRPGAGGWLASAFPAGRGGICPSSATPRSAGAVAAGRGNPAGAPCYPYAGHPLF
jgi:tRNA1Val (adenine37-N6)-methyltransferase